MKPFSSTLAEIRGGNCNDEMAEAIAEVTRQVRLTGKAGSVTLKLSIEPATPGDSERIVLHDEVTSRLPKPPQPATFFFADDHNNLSLKDPQQTLFTQQLANPPAQPPLADAPAPMPMKGATL